MQVTLSRNVNISRTLTLVKPRRKEEKQLVI